MGILFSAPKLPPLARQEFSMIFHISTRTVDKYFERFFDGTKGSIVFSMILSFFKVCVPLGDKHAAKNMTSLFFRSTDYITASFTGKPRRDPALLLFFDWMIIKMFARKADKDQILDMFYWSCNFFWGERALPPSTHRRKHDDKKNMFAKVITDEQHAHEKRQKAEEVRNRKEREKHARRAHSWLTSESRDDADYESDTSDEEDRVDDNRDEDEKILDETSETKPIHCACIATCIASIFLGLGERQFSKIGPKMEVSEGKKLAKKAKKRAWQITCDIFDAAGKPIRSLLSSPGKLFLKMDVHSMTKSELREVKEKYMISRDDFMRVMKSKEDGFQDTIKTMINQFMNKASVHFR